jgi:hypothetical protein
VSIGGTDPPSHYRAEGGFLAMAIRKFFTGPRKEAVAFGTTAQ